MYVAKFGLGLTLFYMTFQRKKNAHLWGHLEVISVRLKISWVGCQINPIDVSFHLQKSLKIFDKILSKKY